MLIVGRANIKQNQNIDKLWSTPDGPSFGVWPKPLRHGILRLQNGRGGRTKLLDDCFPPQECNRREKLRGSQIHADGAQAGNPARNPAKSAQNRKSSGLGGGTGSTGPGKAEDGGQRSLPTNSHVSQGAGLP